MSLYKALFWLKKQHASGVIPDISKSGIQTKIKEVQVNAQNLSTQKASEKKGAWLQKENGYCWRQKCTQEKTR